MEWLWSMVGYMLIASIGAAIGILIYRRISARRTMCATIVTDRIDSHFQPISRDQIIVGEREFPHRVRADLQSAIDDLLGPEVTMHHFCGVQKQYDHDGINFAKLLIESHDPVYAVPPQYEEVDIGEDELVRCLKNALWLVESGGVKFAVLLASNSRFTGCGQETVMSFQVATPNDDRGTQLAADFFKKLEQAVREAKSYRGKVLSLETNDEYSGTSSGITVHKLQKVKAEQVILPRKTLELLDRNLIQFIRQRPQLKELGLATKKGVLFYGPPGTGKTHMIHYLTGAMTGHTTLLISAEQVALLPEYMTLARLLQPSIVVIEDVDLIARDRASMRSGGEEVLLNKLLNEMDGLKPNAEIIFILTTNRPETLESALASRPGRVDQAIEFPLPDAEGREKLVQLYARGVRVPNEVVVATVKKTESVSASFIKELMRRATQFHLEKNGSGELAIEDIDDALEELLFSGGSLNRMLLGAPIEGKPPPISGTSQD